MEQEQRPCQQLLHTLYQHLWLCLNWQDRSLTFSLLWYDYNCVFNCLGSLNYKWAFECVPLENLRIQYIGSVITIHVVIIPFSSPEALLLLDSTKNHNLWLEPIFWACAATLEVCDLQTSNKSDWLRIWIKNECSVQTQKIGSGQSLQILVLTKKPLERRMW